jgi:tripartite-type tricarboxylate transporter receptor subunit TctC
MMLTTSSAKRLLRSVLAASLLAMFSIGESQALYPERALRIVVPFAPGGGTDVVARTLAQEMARDLGVSVIIENKPGAGTIIGTQAVAVSAADGYTLLMATFSHAVNASLSQNALRSAPGFRTGRDDRTFLQHRRGQSQICHSIDCGSDRGGRGQS